MSSLPVLLIRLFEEAGAFQFVDEARFDEAFGVDACHLRTRSGQ